jgi:GNAT superfamily N-acetyltransferase
MTELAEILELFEQQMRRDPIAPPGTRVEKTDALVRIVGKENCILYSDLDDNTARQVVAEQADLFRRQGAEVEWKYFGYDEPRNLESILEQEGFVADEPETVVVLELTGRSIGGPAPPGVEIRQVTDGRGAQDAAAANEAAFGPEHRSTSFRYEDIIRDPTQSLFVAYSDRRPIASGRLEMLPKRSFASLWGGGTAPEHRHRGVYRALVAARAGVARSRGYRFLTVDARETSRPILERLGFTPLTTTRGWVLRPVVSDESPMS